MHPVQPGCVQPTEVHNSSPGLRQQSTWTRAVEMYTSLGQQVLSTSIPVQKPWSGHYRQYVCAKSQLVASLTEETQYALESGKSTTLSPMRYEKPVSRPYQCSLCFTRSTKMRGMERHFITQHPELSEEQYIYSFTDERSSRRLVNHL